MSFLKEHCSLFSVNEPKDLEGFNCGDLDIDEFFANDCFGFTKQLLGKTYCYRLNEKPDKVVCAFTLANAGVRVSDLPNARRKKIEAGIPHAKALKDYPAVLVARLGVSSEFRSKHIGSDVLDFIKIWFIEPLNKTGCRFVIVVTDWLRNRNTLEFIGIWEKVYNPSFNYGEFATVKNNYGKDYCTRKTSYHHKSQ